MIRRWFRNTLQERLVRRERGPMVRLVLDLVRQWMAGQDPAEKLRLLFELDAELYRLQGRISREYEGGPHAKHRIIGYHEFFATRLKAGWRVLDVGCANGALSRAMAENAGVSVLGVELAPDKVAAAQRDNAHPQVEYLIGDVLLDLPERPFDAVVLSNVLEHLAGRVEFLTRLRERTGAGVFLIRVPQYDREWRVPLKRELGVDWRLDKTHELEYTEAQLRQEVAEAGLEIVEIAFRWGEIYVAAQPARGG